LQATNRLQIAAWMNIYRQKSKAKLYEQKKAYVAAPDGYWFE